MDNKIAKRIIKKLVADICDRRGLGNEFEQIDDDVKKELLNDWKQLIIEELNEN